MDFNRRIIHIDMDAFFASVEQRDHDFLKGRPIAVGGDGLRSVVSAASYEARKYGVRSAMPGKKALALCPHIVFVKPRFEVYKEVSETIHAIFRKYTDKVEALSLDEAYLDVTDFVSNKLYATQIADEIRREIYQQTRLTASAGVSFNKFLAKVASDYRKPNGMTVVTPNNYQEFLKRLAIDKFYGIGEVTAEKMKSLGVYTGNDLLRFPEEILIEIFGLKSGQYFYKIARGIDDRMVETQRTRKSFGSEQTFLYDIESIREMEEKLSDIAEHLSKRMVKKGIKGRTITLKVKLHDFTVLSKSISLSHSTFDSHLIFLKSIELLAGLHIRRAVRLLGISLSNLSEVSQSSERKPMEYSQLHLDMGSTVHLK